MKNEQLIITLFFGIFSILQGYSQQTTKIKILGADKGTYAEEKYGKARILTGNVRFKHGETLMYCDSAVLSTANSMKAFGNVRVVDKANQSEMTGDSLTFDGNTKTGKLRGNITLVNAEQVLSTRFLDFDLKSNLAYYSSGGVITNARENSVLESKKGYYYSDSKMYFFKDSVSYITQDYSVFSDTMKYSSTENKVIFEGPTQIFSDSNSIYCESGWYNQSTHFSTFTQNVKIVSSDQLMLADSVVYNQQTKLGEAYGNVDISDTVNNVEILGDFALYDNSVRNSMVTGNLELMLFFTKDTMHLHSDTLITSFDSTGEHRLFHAFHHVQFFKPDLQGKCDSLSYSEADSTMKMYIHPVVWADSNQVTGKEIIIKTFDGVIDHMRINEEAFIVTEEATELFNQIKGNSLFAHFRNNEIYQVDVNRSGQTIYYIRDEKDQLMGMNRLDCSNMSIFIDSVGIHSIKFYNQPDGTFFPMKDVTYEMKLLRHFYWRIAERPESEKAIFHWTEVPEYVIKRRQSR